MLSHSTDTLLIEVVLYMGYRVFVLTRW